MAYRNPLCEQLGIDHPIFLGPLGGGFSTAQLTAEVSNGGGLGSFGAHHLSPEAILATAAGIRKLTDRPFALNLWARSSRACLPDGWPEASATGFTTRWRERNGWRIRPRAGWSAPFDRQRLPTDGPT